MRMAMQEIWRNKELDWDDRLSEEESRIWSILFDEMYCLNTLSYPRCLKPKQAHGLPELHTFCDASRRAYGAVVYIVRSTSNGREIQLVTSKVRVSPLRQSTIPRLELMAVLVGSRLAKTVLRVKPNKVVIWSDSHVVLHWIGSESVNMKPFVGVRVTEVQSTWDFNYVPTELNPADDLSRGLTVDKMPERWMSGPEFLKRPESEWPAQPTSLPVTDESELRKVKPIFAVVQSLSPITDPQRFSSYSRLLRVTSYCTRFIERLKAKVQSNHPSVDGQDLTSQLKSEEIDRSEDYWVKVIQKTLLNYEENFRDLCPYVENGVVRVGGRLRHIALSYDQRHPVLLPRDSHVAELVIREYHQKSCHAGAERTLADVRQKYWIPHGRKVVKKVVKSCVVCRKLRQIPCQTLMGDFPAERLRPLSPPFTTTGVDLFGPFMLKYGRNKSIKAWGAIFTCSTTRAIHLEIVQDLSTQSFLFALRRFSAHHGWPKTFISDNGPIS